MQISTKFDILQTVHINEIDADARVLLIRYDGLGIIYELEYWWEGVMKSVNLYEDELSQIKRKPS